MNKLEIRDELKDCLQKNKERLKIIKSRKLIDMTIESFVLNMDLYKETKLEVQSLTEQLNDLIEQLLGDK